VIISAKIQKKIDNLAFKKVIFSLIGCLFSKMWLNGRKRAENRFLPAQGEGAGMLA